MPASVRQHRRRAHAPGRRRLPLGRRRGALLLRQRRQVQRKLRAQQRAVRPGALERAACLCSVVVAVAVRPLARGEVGVAAVFINRLRKKMRLQSDPTVVYGITLGEHPLGRALTRRDLETDTPYNTYRIAALPPGAICNPGKDAIAAVLNPLVSDEFYFVADGTGGHVFAKTLAEHNRNVARWRRLQKKKKR